MNKIKKIAKYKIGDIVLVPFPFSDNTGSKVRPGIIIGIDRDDVNFVFITSLKPRDMFLNIAVDDSNRLKSDSYIRFTKIATLDRKLCVNKLGEVSPEDFASLKESLFNYLSLKAK